MFVLVSCFLLFLTVYSALAEDRQACIDGMCDMDEGLEMLQARVAKIKPHAHSEDDDLEKKIAVRDENNKKQEEESMDLDEESDEEDGEDENDADAALLQESSSTEVELGSRGTVHGGDEEAGMDTDEKSFEEYSNDVGVALIQSINDRFNRGKPSNDLNDMGVLVHLSDRDGLQPEIVSDRFTDVYSASIVNRQTPFMFPFLFLHVPSVGLIISPEAAASSLLCSYSQDARTNQIRACNDTECVPGCIGDRYFSVPGEGLKKGRTEWCKGSDAAQTCGDSGKAFAPVNVSEMMQSHQDKVSNYFDHCGTDAVCLACHNGSTAKCYQTAGYQVRRLWNEVVLDPVKLITQWSSAVEAIFFVEFVPEERRHSSPKKSSRAVAQATQQEIFNKFGKHVPLCRLTDFSQQTPFEYIKEPFAEESAMLHHMLLH